MRVEFGTSTSVLENIFRKGRSERVSLKLAARLLGCSPDDLHTSPNKARTSSPDTATLDGSEAVFLSCLEMALTDGVITDDEEALLTTYAQNSDLWGILERPRGNGPPRHDEMMWAQDVHHGNDGFGNGCS